MLHFFNPVMFEQALELRIEILVVFDALEVMTLDHPLDVKRRDRHGQWIVSQDRGCDRLRWSITWQSVPNPSSNSVRNRLKS